MAKDFDYVLDLGKFSGTKTGLSSVIRECAAARPPPLTPADFALALADKSFTSKKADEDMVARLYEATFRLRMGQATALIYSSMQWGDAEVAVLCKVLASGSLAQLQVRSRLTASSPCLEAWHTCSPGLTVLFDVPYVLCAAP